MMLRTLKAAVSEPDTVFIRGREYVIIPVVALVEGVRHPHGAPHPELILADSFGRYPDTWDGRPVVVNHPVDAEGRPCMASQPHILEEVFLGYMFDSRIEDGKLKVNAYLDLAAIEAAESDLVKNMWQRLLDGEIIEVSVGAIVEIIAQTGTYGSTKYSGKWDTVIPDHLAFLSDAEGACSIEDGCGTFRTQSSGKIQLNERFRTMAKAGKPASATTTHLHIDARGVPAKVVEQVQTALKTACKCEDKPVSATATERALYSPDQPRDENGQWTSGGGAAATEGGTSNAGFTPGTGSQADGSYRSDFADPMMNQWTEIDPSADGIDPATLQEYLTDAYNQAQQAPLSEADQKQYDALQNYYNSMVASGGYTPRAVVPDIKSGVPGAIMLAPTAKEWFSPPPSGKSTDKMQKLRAATCKTMATSLRALFAADTYNRDRETLLTKALRDKMGRDFYGYVSYFNDNTVVYSDYCSDSYGYWSIGYTSDSSDRITIVGEPIAVVNRMTFVPAPDNNSITSTPMTMETSSMSTAPATTPATPATPAVAVPAVAAAPAPKTVTELLETLKASNSPVYAALAAQIGVAEAAKEKTMSRILASAGGKAFTKEILSAHDFDSLERIAAAIDLVAAVPVVTAVPANLGSGAPANLAEAPTNYAARAGGEPGSTRTAASNAIPAAPKIFEKAK
jgi:hypothetical protein